MATIRECWLAGLHDWLLNYNGWIQSLEKPVHDFIMDFFDDPLYSQQPDSGNMAGRILLRPETCLSVSVYLYRRGYGLLTRLSHAWPDGAGVRSCLGDPLSALELPRWLVNGWGRFRRVVHRAMLVVKGHRGLHPGSLQGIPTEQPAVDPLPAATAGRPLVHKKLLEITKCNKQRPGSMTDYGTYVNIERSRNVFRKFIYVMSGIFTSINYPTNLYPASQNRILKTDRWKSPASDPFLTIFALKKSLWSPSVPHSYLGKPPEKLFRYFFCFLQRVNLLENTRFSSHSFC